MQARGDDLSKIAVLVRAGFQTREFEERFIAIGLPYRVVGTRFYERAEIRDAIAYLRLIAQPADDLAFERIVNVPKRGLGTASIQAIHVQARAPDKPLMAAAIDLVTTDELRPAARTALGGFCQDIARWRMPPAVLHHTDLAKMVLDESGYTAMWQADRSPEAEGRLENLTELVNAMQDFDTLQGFLEHISLVMDGDNESEQGEVTLMTLHAAKGLEFDTVFMPGWEEGIFPSQRTIDENGAVGLEEERRLAYVGITRARRQVYLSLPAAAASMASGSPRSRRALCRSCRQRRSSRMLPRGLAAAFPLAAPHRPSLPVAVMATARAAVMGRDGDAWQRGANPAPRTRFSPHRAMLAGLLPVTASSTRNSAWVTWSMWMVTSWKSPSTGLATKKSLPVL